MREVRVSYDLLLAGERGGGEENQELEETFYLFRGHQNVIPRFKFINYIYFLYI